MIVVVFQGGFWLGESLSNVIVVGSGVVCVACPAPVRFPLGGEGDIPGAAVPCLLLAPTSHSCLHSVPYLGGYTVWF